MGNRWLTLSTDMTAKAAASLSSKGISWSHVTADIQDSHGSVAAHISAGTYITLLRDVVRLDIKRIPSLRILQVRTSCKAFMRRPLSTAQPCTVHLRSQDLLQCCPALRTFHCLSACSFDAMAVLPANTSVSTIHLRFRSAHLSDVLQALADLIYTSLNITTIHCTGWCAYNGNMTSLQKAADTLMGVMTSTHTFSRMHLQFIVEHCCNSQPFASSMVGTTTACLQPRQTSH
jgi:hypothetical protein